MSILTFVNHVATETPFNQSQTRQIKFSCFQKDSQDFSLDEKTGLATYKGKKDKKFKVLFQFRLQTTAKGNEIQSFVNINNNVAVPLLASVITSNLVTDGKQQIVLNDVVTLKNNDVVCLGGFLQSGPTQTLIYSNVYAEFIEIQK
jgi:hypothetical protein